jgi:ribosomal protein S18 acetylase RimI-like enzyme
MPKEIIYRLVNASETQQVVNLHRASFPPQHVARTIFGTRGIAAYLSALIGLPGFSSSQSILGAWDKLAMVGYAYGRTIGESWHLNYIAVLPAYQSCGIGQSLWQAWSKQRRNDSRELTLDVEEINRAAVAWYEGLGFRPVRRTWSYEKELSLGPPSRMPSGDATPLDGSLELLDWDNAQAWQRVYGFSQFQIASARTVWQVGRLGENYFRVTAILPAHIEHALHEMDASRKLLVVSSEPLQSAYLSEAGVSLRMANSIHA